MLELKHSLILESVIIYLGSLSYIQGLNGGGFLSPVLFNWALNQCLCWWFGTIKQRHGNNQTKYKSVNKN